MCVGEHVEICSDLRVTQELLMHARVEKHSGFLTRIRGAQPGFAGWEARQCPAWFSVLPVKSVAILPLWSLLGSGSLTDL